MRSGSWSYSGFRAPWNESRQTFKETLQSLGGPEWCSIRGMARPDGISPQSVEMFLYRCEIAVQYLRDERAKLAGIRIELWGAGHDQQKTCDFLGLTRAELLWLDEQIRNVLKFPSRARKILPDEMICIRRKAKAGWARDVIRRWQRGYKQTYVSLFQQRNASYEKPSPIYGGEEHVKGDDEDSTGTTAYSNGDEDALLSTVGLSGDQ